MFKAISGPLIDNEWETLPSTLSQYSYLSLNTTELFSKSLFVVMSTERWKKKKILLFGKKKYKKCTIMKDVL